MSHLNTLRPDFLNSFPKWMRRINTCFHTNPWMQQHSKRTGNLLYPTLTKPTHTCRSTSVQPEFLLPSSALMRWELMCVLVIQVNAFACGAYFHSGSHCTHILLRTAVPLLFTHADVFGITRATLLRINLLRVMCHTVVVLIKVFEPWLCIPSVQCHTAGSN